MRPYHLIISGAGASEARRVDFTAESPDHAFQIARNEEDGVHVELWEGAKLLARMTKGDANIWQLLPARPDNIVAIEVAAAQVPSLAPEAQRSSV